MDGTAFLAEMTVGPAARRARDVLVLGLGNALLADDGVGDRVGASPRQRPRETAGLRPLDGGTLGFRLMAALIESDSAIVTARAWQAAS